MEETVAGPSEESLALAAPSAPSRNALEEIPWSEPPVSTAISQSPPPAPVQKPVGSKDRAIAELKKQIDSVLSKVRDASGNFRQIDRLDQVSSLPPSVSSEVMLLANQAREVRLAVGSDTMLFQHRDEMQAVDSLVVADEASGDISAKDAPTARKELSQFLQRYSEPSENAQKPLWRYINSMFSLCDGSMKAAEPHLQRARSLEAVAKRSEALREYQEIYRVYPNPATAAKIRELQNPR